MQSLITRNDDGTVNSGPVLFLTTCVLLVNWTLLPISMAVLVDRFVAVSASAAAEERAQRVREAKDSQVVSKYLAALSSNTLKVASLRSMRVLGKS